jgi:hypothetical protein
LRKFAQDINGKIKFGFLILKLIGGISRYSNYYRGALNNQRILDRDTERKGKLVEKRGRKATGLKLKSHDSRVAEQL